MTLIEIVVDYLGLTTNIDKENIIQLYCPYEFDIFKGYVQGKKEYCGNNGCSECWNSEPIEL